MKSPSPAPEPASSVFWLPLPRLSWSPAPLPALIQLLLPLRMLSWSPAPLPASMTLLLPLSSDWMSPAPLPTCRRFELESAEEPDIASLPTISVSPLALPAMSELLLPVPTVSVLAGLPVTSAVCSRLPLETVPEASVAPTDRWSLPPEPS